MDGENQRLEKHRIFFYWNGCVLKSFAIFPVVAVLRGLLLYHCYAVVSNKCDHSFDVDTDPYTLIYVVMQS